MIRKDKFKFEWVNTGIPEIDNQQLKVSGDFVTINEENNIYLKQAIKEFETILNKLSTIEEKYFAMYLRAKVENILSLGGMSIFDDGGVKQATVLEVMTLHENTPSLGALARG